MSDLNRALFEAAYPGTDLSRATGFECDGSTYRSPVTQARWEGFQAARSAVPASAPEVVDEPIMIGESPVEDMELDLLAEYLDEKTAFNGKGLEAAWNKLVKFYVAHRTAAQPQAQGDTSERVAVKQDAARWRALLASARIHIIGSAGINQDTNPDGEPYNGYAHFGMEIWTKYGSSLSEDQKRQMEAGNVHGRAVLTKYADIAADNSPAQQEPT